MFTEVNEIINHQRIIFLDILLINRNIYAENNLRIWFYNWFATFLIFVRLTDW